jgi:ribonuclease E
MKKEMLINVMQPEECRIAIIEDGVLEELYVERTSHESYVGNIYKGRIVNIEPSIQAAFVDFGVGRNGFLHVSDVEPAYYRHLEMQRGNGNGGRRGGGRGDRGDRGRDRDRDRGRRPRRGAEDSHRSESTAFFDEAVLEDLERVADEPEAATREAAPAEPPAGTEPEPGPQGRGRSRRRRPGKDEPVPREPGTAAADDEPQARAADDEPPRFMESAERRTEEDTPPSEPLQPKGEIRDEDLFFPRGGAEPEERPGAREPELSAEPEEEYDSPSPVSIQRAPADFDEPEEPTVDVDESADLEPEAGRGGHSPAAHDLDDFDDGTDLVDYPEERVQSFDEDDAPMPRRGGRRDGPRDGPRRGRFRRMGGRPGAGRPKPLIQDIFKRGQEVLVQVIKEGIGTKGPTLSTYISIAGRYLVLMPGLNRVGVSRKIADDDQRRRLRDIFHELQPPKGLGFIIRTAGLDKTKKELQRDLAYLARLWQVVVRRIRKIKAPAEIYQESDMITRTIRDTFTNDIDTIWVDEPAAYEHAQEFMQIVMPRYASRIKLFEEPEPMFHKYGIEDEIARIQMRHVPLPNGGSIVIDQTEALVAIDVNSGNFRADNNAEETAYQMNLQAAKEIARQLRLRDLGGVVVNDFIDMREEKHRRGVERALRDAIKRDRARTKILKMSAFGLIEMTRQRIRPSLKRSVYQDCPHCHNTGQVKTCESMSIDVMRMIQLAAHRPTIHRAQIRVSEEVASYLLNKKRREIARLEEAGEIQVAIAGLFGVSPETLEFTCYDNNNNEVKFLPTEEVRVRRR